MTILTPEEKEFLDVFLHEATTSPFFNGPATKALYAIGVELKSRCCHRVQPPGLP
jgi:hypothetical protein